MNITNKTVQTVNVMRRDWRSAKETTSPHSMTIEVFYCEQHDPGKVSYLDLGELLDASLDGVFIVAHDDPHLELLQSCATEGIFNVLVMDNADIQWVAKEVYECCANFLQGDGQLDKVRLRTDNGISVEYRPGVFS